MDSTLGTKDVDTYYEKFIEPKKNKLRLEYINKISFIYDFKILILTFLKIFKLI